MVPSCRHCSICAIADYIPNSDPALCLESLDMTRLAKVVGHRVTVVHICFDVSVIRFLLVGRGMGWIVEFVVELSR